MKRSILATLALSSLTGFMSLPRDASAAPSRAAERPGAVVQRDPSLRLLVAADADGDGSISRAELGAVVERTIFRRVLTRFKQLDRDHDGVVTRNEVPKLPATRFARFDTNRDGRFTRAELAAVMTREAVARLEQRFAELDVDRDARCTRAELAARLDAPAPALVALRDRTQR